MHTLFLACWFAGLAGWIYGSCYWFPMWSVGFKKRDRHRGYWLKSLIGFAVFLASDAMVVAAAFIAETWGGGWGA